MQLTDADLEHIRKYLLIPITDSLDDFKNAMSSVMDEVRATLRTINDPMSGYVPRAQIDLMFEKEDRDKRDLWSAINTLREDQQKSQTNLIKWVVATALTAIGVTATVLMLIHAYSGGAPIHQ